MRPIYLKMTAFGSYQEETIDFSEVKNGLFLITGDTGAGKTTIFDAIMFALFNETSGGQRDGEMMHSQYAGQGIVSKVELAFAYHGQQYRIVRRPKQNRYKEVKDEQGNRQYEKLKTPLGMEVELTMPDGSVFPGKSTETDQKIREIIGMDAEQFRQVAMIPQGEFMRLLQASSKERMAIFAKIFDTEVYADIERSLASLAKESWGKLAENKKDIEKEFARIRYEEPGAAPQGHDAEEAYEELGVWKESEKESQLQVLSDVIAQQRAERSAVEQSLEENGAQTAVLQSVLDSAQTVNDLFAQLDRLKEEQKSLAQTQADMEALGRWLADGAAVVVQVEPEDGLSSGDVRAQIAQLEETLSQSREKKEQSQLRLKEERLVYDAEVPELERQITKLSDAMESYREWEQITEELSVLQKNLCAGRKTLEEKQEIIRDIKKILQESQALEEQLKAETAEAEMLRHQMEQLEETRKEVSQLLEETEAFAGTKTAAQTAEKTYLEGQRLLEEQKAYYEEQYQIFLGNQAAVMAANLQEGEPCPVCGSVHHIRLAEGSLDGMTEADIKRLHRQVEKASGQSEKEYKNWQEAKQKVEIALAVIQKSGAKLFGRDAAKPETLMELAGRRQEELAEAWAEGKRQQTELAEKLERIKSLQTEEENQNTRLEQAIAQAEELGVQINRWEVQQASVQGRMDVLKKQLAFGSEAQAKEQLADWQAQLGERKNRMAQLEAEYTSAEEAYTRYQGQCAAFVNRYREQQKLVDVQLRLVEVQTEGRERTDTKELEEKIARLKSESGTLQERDRRLYSAITVNEMAYKKCVQLYREREKLKHRDSIIGNLNKTANGKLDGKHLNFQTYIQRRYFKRVIELANRRLYEMSNHQFLLQCRELENLGGSGYVGLELDVYSIVNDQIRDIKTLSGGESFMAALAMALGMADIIQNSRGSIHIDTMFIDEGFGSLSEETRNQAIAILNQLSGGSHLVGIISHVSELKAQIDTKLVVEKTAKGSKAHWEGIL